MKLFRLASTLGGTGLLAASLGGCLKAPDYSTTPEISFNEIKDTRLQPKVSGGVVQDSIRLTVNYQDGDGDLGLNSDERKALLGTANYNNYFIEPYVKQVNSKVYVSAASLGRTAVGTYNSAYPHVTTLTDNKAAPIKGTLTLALIPFILGQTFLPNEKVKFSIQISDRAKHLSNVVMTDSVVIGPR